MRDNVRLNLDRELSSWLRLGVSTSYIQSNADLTPNGGIVAQSGGITLAAKPTGRLRPRLR